ncbi:unnamed protein product [Cylicocyclus nassatus]|uniref:G patch domain-containing protein 11 n=1 Tax=Cylicocyclus nassatus TaxID=53992 RepID=A0AA36DMH1_CYLNA|nr:unnamed protein product [Cylicocyclus nassatus]
MADDEDDYMSDNFLAMTQDVKPGIAISAEHRRMLKIESERVRARREDFAKPKKRELEKAIREEALSKPVPETSKGFALMAKMGFKPGMSLGKKKDGIKEPITLEVKVSRTGLGHDSEQENQAKQRLREQMDRMKRRAAQTVELIDDYKKRKREMVNTKDLIRDIIASRKVCVELDLRLVCYSKRFRAFANVRRLFRTNVELPEQPWFWKSYKQRDADDALDPHLRQGSSDDIEARYSYANGKEAPPEERFDELGDDELLERLSQITCYLRTAHLYCIWCGCQFDRQEELEDYCPGTDKQAHDSIDD